MSSGLDMASGRIRGMAATHVLNRSILGFLSPLSKMEGDVKQACLRQGKLAICNSKYSYVMIAPVHESGGNLREGRI